MRTSAETTRNSAFFAHRDSGDLGGQQRKVMLAFHAPSAPRDMSLNEISEATGIRLSSVSGRCNELKALGYLVESTVRRDKITDRTVTPLRLPSAQLELLS